MSMADTFLGNIREVRHRMATEKCPECGRYSLKPVSLADSNPVMVCSHCVSKGKHPVDVYNGRTAGPGD